MSLKDEHPAKSLPSASFHDMEALKQTAELCAAEFLEAFQRVNGTLGTDLVRKTEVKTIRQRNALLPIQKLSEELLLLVFQGILLTSTARRRRHYVRRISALRAVSSVWRDLIDRTPLFWTHVSSNDHPDFVSDALEKSLNLPLHLKYTVFSPSESESAFFDKASAHQTRWKSVALHEPSAELLQTYFHVPNPFITALLLSDIGYASGEAGLDKLLGGEVANLEELRAVGWKNIVWSEAHLTQLRILEIEDYQMLGMEVIFNILAENPSLEILRLCSITFARYTPPFPAPPQINMEHLVELKLAGIEQELETGTERAGAGGGDVAIAHILQHIRSPACHKFEIQLRLRDGSGISPEELIDLIPPPMQVLSRGRPEVSDPKHATVNAYFEEERLQIRAFRDPRSRPSCTIALIDFPNTIARKWLIEQMGEESGRTLDLRLRFDYSEGQLSLDDIAFFQRWESVTCLDIIGPSHPPNIPSPNRELLWHLSTPFVSENGAKMMPFPRLKTLRLSDLPFKGKDLVDSITLRFHSDTPAPEELTIILGDGPGGRSESYFGSVRTIAGVKDVRFYGDLEMDETCSVSSESDWPPHRETSDQDYST
ncbi:hypothetical protein FRC00_004269 [Tulasnella sp. 408]|nr:hypothetical protein FRC00_004269 [Tulasnella sp. 408]